MKNIASLPWECTLQVTCSPDCWYITWSLCSSAIRTEQILQFKVKISLMTEVTPDYDTHAPIKMEEGRIYLPNILICKGF